MALPETVATEEEKPTVTEIPRTPEVPPGLKGVEKVVKEEVVLPQPIVDNDQIMLDNAAPQQVTVTLPLTDEEMNRALHLKIIYSLRWLAEWMKRLLKKVGGKFLYKSQR